MKTARYFLAVVFIVMASFVTTGCGQPESPPAQDTPSTNVPAADSDEAE